MPEALFYSLAQGKFSLLCTPPPGLTLSSKSSKRQATRKSPPVRGWARWHQRQVTAMAMDSRIEAAASVLIIGGGGLGVREC